MVRIRRMIAGDASDAFWAAATRAIERDDLASFKEAVRKIRQDPSEAATAIADVIEADEELEKVPPIVRWLIAARRGEKLRWCCTREATAHVLKIRGKKC